MPKRRSLTLLDDLPEEIIDKILIRLPSKDIRRCRAVSTSWRSATSRPEFMLEHHRRQPLVPIINGNYQPANYVVGAGGSSQLLLPFLPGTQNVFLLYASCDGFLIVRHCQNYRFYIFNPVIRKYALLPLPQDGKGISNTVIGFYRHHPTGEYRVLCLSRPLQFSQSSLYILTVGSDEARHVTVKMPAVLLPSMEEKLFFELHCWPNSLHHRGSLHWCSKRFNDIKGGDGDIIVFDTEAESFRWMHSPAQQCPNTDKELFDMKETLAFWGSSTPGFNGFTAINVWVMQDYEAEIWDFKYRIDLSTVEASRQLFLTSVKKKKKKKTPLDSTVELFNDMAVLNEDELLIKFNKKNVLRCDVGGKFLGIVKFGKSQYCMTLTQHRFQESIIPIPSHEMQEDEELPFSTGHL